MVKRDYKLYLNDIRESIAQIEKYMLGVSEEVFRKDKKLQDAIVMRIMIIGEATRNLPKVLKEKNREVPWFEIAQFRDLIAHSYYEVSLNRIWSTINERIPVIKEKLKNISLV